MVKLYVNRKHIKIKEYGYWKYIMIKLCVHRKHIIVKIYGYLKHIMIKIMFITNVL